MEQVAPPDPAANGGFPEPPEGEPVRVVSARHDDCGAETRVRLPVALRAGAVRRVSCSGCGAAFAPAAVEDVEVEAAPGGANGSTPAQKPGVSAPAKRREPRKRPSLPKFDPQSRFWRLASLPLMAAAVIGALLLIQGGGGDGAEPAPAPAPAPEASEERPAKGGGGGAAGAGDSAQRPEPIGELAKKAQVVSGSNYTLALPPRWQRVEPPRGATFMAVEKDGGADATLWIDNNPGLDLPTFIARSMKQLEALGGSARVVERTPGPTPESTSVRIAADAPPGEPTLEATLRAAGPYRYYLATTVFPDAPPKAIEGVDLIVESFVPETGGGK